MICTKKKPWLMSGYEERGYVLGLVMIFFIIFAILGHAFIRMGGFEKRHVSSYLHQTRAFYHAEGGLHRSLWLLNHVSHSACTYSDEIVTVVFDSVNSVITSTGKSGNVENSIRAILKSDDTGKYIVATWQKL